MMRQLVIALASAATASSTFASAPSLEALPLSPGFASGYAYDISSDGRVIVGSASGDASHRPVRWVGASDPLPLLHPPGGPSIAEAVAVSADGSVIVGYSSAGSPFKWTPETGAVPLPFQSSSAHLGLSGDGSTIVGFTFTPTGAVAWRWRSGAGLEYLPGGEPSLATAHGTSFDGSIVVGASETPAGGFEAVRWDATGAVQYLGLLPDRPYSHALRVSTDGAVVVGFSGIVNLNAEGFIWFADSGMRSIGNLPGHVNCMPYDLSHDGGVVVGADQTDLYNFDAFYWTREQGMRSLSETLFSLGVDVQGWQLRSAYGVTPDGQTVVGTAIDPQGREVAYRATLPEPQFLVVALALALRARCDRRRACGARADLINPTDAASAACCR